jgi:8-oxo-dGTP diphosphatase
VREFAGDLENRIFAQVRWTRLEELPEFDFLAADRGLIRDLASGKLL